MILKDLKYFSMYLDLEDNGISKHLYDNGYREALFTAIMYNTVKPGMVCLDIGVNIGYGTLWMLDSLEGEGKVIAVEPDPLIVVKPDIDHIRVADI